MSKEVQSVQRLSIRITETEADLVNILSELEGQTPSEFVRDLAVDGLFHRVASLDPVEENR